MKKNYLAIALLISGITVQVNAQWNITNSPTGLPELEDIHFTSQTNGYAVGGSSTLSGGSAVILSTTNGGSSWTNIHSISAGSLLNFRFDNLEFVDANTAYAVGGAGGSSAGASAIISKTTDGGSSWTQLSHNMPEDRIHDTHFLNANEGFCVGDEIYKTTDGGVTWVEISSPSFAALSKIVFTDQNTGYATGAEVLKTTDGGLTWVNIYYPPMNNYMNEMYFVDQNTGFIAGSSSSIYKTTDAGNSWTQVSVSISNTSASFKSLEFSSPLVGFAGNTDGYVLKTIDGGDNWFENYDASSPSFIISASIVTDIHFINPNDGFLAVESLLLNSYVGGTNNAGGGFVSTDENALTEMKFYPNPATNTLTFENPKNESQTLDILTLEGKTVLSENINLMERKTLDISNIPSGVYLIAFHNENKIEKLIIQ